MDPRDIPAARWRAAQGRSRSVAAAWRAGPDARAFAAAFDDDAAIDPVLAIDRARGMLGDPGLAGRLIGGLADALAAEPLLDPPLRASRGRGHIGATLLAAPGGRLVAAVLSSRALAAETADVVVPGHITVTRYVRSAGAVVRRWRVNVHGRLVAQAPLHPADGDIVIHDGRHTAQVVASAASDVATLSIVLTAGAASVARAFRPDGTPTRVASGDDAAGRSAMLLTLLRVAGRRDAGALFAAATRDPAPHARWSAMREWLALDASAALPRLRAITTDDPDPQVRAAAHTTLTRINQPSTLCRG